MRFVGSSVVVFFVFDLADFFRTSARPIYQLDFAAQLCHLQFQFLVYRPNPGPQTPNFAKSFLYVVVSNC